MAHNLPDEVLKEILAPPLVISDDEFSFAGRPKDSPFGRTPRHSSSLLLVCKQWMRVATPLLYEVAIIRSTAQAQSLAYAVKSNKAFGKFIKRLRMEGGFGKAPAIFIAAAPNIRELFVTLDLWSSDSPSGLCSVLSGMSPCRVIITHHYYELQNAKAVQLWDSLSVSVDKWSHMETLEYHSPSEKFLDLFSYIHTMPSVKHIVLKDFDILVLTHLASTTTLETIRVTQTLLPSHQSLIDHNPRLLKLLHFKTKTPEEAIPTVVPFTAVVAGFTPLTNVPLHVAKSIWDLIFSFATCSYDVETMLLRSSPDVFNRSPTNLMSTALSLSMVSKFFHDIAKRHLFSVVHIGQAENLAAFNLILRNDDTVGPLVRVLRFTIRRKYDMVGGYDYVVLPQLLPKLTGLISLHVHLDDLQQLKVLSQLTSTTIQVLELEVHLTDIQLGRYELEAVDIGVLAGLKHLKCSIISPISLTRMPFLIAQLPKLTSLDTGPFTIFGGDGLDLLDGIRMPSLARLRMVEERRTSSKFLKLNGETLKILNIFETPSPELWTLCPQLESVTVSSSRHKHPVASLLRPPSGKPYPSLSQLRMDHKPRGTVRKPENLEKRLVAITEGFEDVDFSLFPNLKDVHLGGFTWPNTERDIKKTPRFSNFALCLKKWGITVYDSTGTPWRERAQIRRGR
ncbi:hypothetical protein BD410DRAFT_893169 [Rickenella mellea]|uniref:Uncharacterized protein n=1 Tax=Rickenella mellea TaxID=50990 RepID=A0A4R5XH62_9AGAM|nr:hypothetical protein BD410DRAFT_893169 [Rickenella mellea]